MAVLNLSIRQSEVLRHGFDRRLKLDFQGSNVTSDADPGLPKEVEHWSLTTIREKLVKIGAKVVAHDRYVTFQMADVAVPHDLFRNILRRIEEQRPPAIAAA